MKAPTLANFYLLLFFVLLSIFILNIYNIFISYFVLILSSGIFLAFSFYYFKGNFSHYNNILDYIDWEISDDSTGSSFRSGNIFTFFLSIFLGRESIFLLMLITVVVFLYSLHGNTLDSGLIADYVYENYHNSWVDVCKPDRAGNDMEFYKNNYNYWLLNSKDDFLNWSFKIHYLIIAVSMITVLFILFINIKSILYYIFYVNINNKKPLDLIFFHRLSHLIYSFMIIMIAFGILFFNSCPSLDNFLIFKNLQRPLHNG